MSNLLCYETSNINSQSILNNFNIINQLYDIYNNKILLVFNSIFYNIYIYIYRIININKYIHYYNLDIYEDNTKKYYYIYIFNSFIII